jgi:hypothetical protein
MRCSNQILQEINAARRSYMFAIQFRFTNSIDPLVRLYYTDRAQPAANFALSHYLLYFVQVR